MSWASSDANRQVMKANRRRDTQPEILVRRLLHARGLRFRVDFAAEPGVRSRPDVVFTRQRIAVYIDGCFWHRCPLHGTAPKSNSDYWRPKLDRNVERDQAVTAELRERGWIVLRFWEHEPADAVAEVIFREVSAASERGASE